jgi:hypothetical protein
MFFGAALSAANFLPPRLAPVSRVVASPPLSPRRFPERIRRLRPYWWAVTVPLLVAVSALFATTPIRDAVTGLTVPEATLAKPTMYVLLAPISNLLDTLTLLSLRQHAALMLTLLLTFALWWWRRGHRVPATITRARRAIRQAARIGLALVGLVSVYAAAILLPRPMASLEVGSDILAIDFHAHTRYSHDGRWDWSAEDLRRWHREAGYAVAYVTDHRTFEGARDGWANNPALSGEGTSLMPAIEVVWKGEHVNVLDADRMYKGIFTATLRDIDEDALRLASAIPGREPVIIETLPGDLGHLIPATGPGTAGVRAIELIDGAPKGLGQTRRERARIIRLADSLHLAMVTGTDSHGWGRVAQGWTLMSLPRWRAATPAQLTEAISSTIRASGSGATRVVERWIPDTESGVALPLAVPIVLWGMLRTLSPDERVIWIIWTMVAAGYAWLRARRRLARLG